jgi:1-acyl-sn-glycerol-3-phosphate acyltransferase
MKKLLSYPLTVLFYLFYGLALLIFHPIQWVCFNVFGYQAHKKSVDILNFFLIATTYILGTRNTFSNPHKLPKGAPCIIVSNHQSQYDISPLIWHLRKLHPKFVSKVELGKGIPSISYNLRHGGSVLIDRKNPRQSLPALKNFATYLQENNRSTVIFPEGTRGKKGMPKRFAPNGLKTLFKYMPNAWIVPVTINNSWKLVEHGAFPMNIGVHLKHNVHKPFPISEFDDVEELLAHIEHTITKDILITKQT